MDSRIGLDYIVENGDYTTKLGAGKKKNWINLITFITKVLWILLYLFYTTLVLWVMAISKQEEDQ
jgi:hypothetical protein